MSIELRPRFNNLQALADEIIRAVEGASELAAKDVAETWKQNVEGGTPVGIRKGHAETTKRAWTNVSPSPEGFSFGNPEDHIMILEEGGYPGVGPRTTPGENPSTGSGIFSRRAPSGIVAPLLNDEKFMHDIAEVIVEQFKEALGRIGDS